MKSILYFLEPRTELENPLFRYATLRSHIIPEIKSLKDFDPSLDIKLILSESLANEAKEKELDTTCADLLIIKDNAFKKLTKNNNEISVELHHGNIEEHNNIILKDAITGIIPDSFTPDISISYESPAPFIKEIFPNVVHLNAMFGIFSRAPFPAFGMLDPEGLYEYSTQTKHISEINNFKTNPEEEEVVNLLRRQSTKALAKFHPLKTYLSSLDERYTSLVVLACQVDNYFSYNGCTEYKNHFEMVDDVLFQTPQDIGVIVTEHSYSKQLTIEEINYLKEKYSNFIYFDKDIPTATQFILPYVDGALSVSSSIGYQSALWKIPYYSLGNSQLSIFSHHKSLSDFFNDIKIKLRPNHDNVIYLLLSRLHISHKADLFNGENYFNILSNLYKNISSGLKGLDVFNRIKSPAQLTEEIIAGNREWLLKKNMVDLHIPVEIDHLRVAMSECDAASFDLFDTLGERDFVEPHELFGFIEPKVRKYLKNKNFQFHYIRRQAEIDLRRESRGEFELNLDQIYSRFDKYINLSQEHLDGIKSIEIEAEIELVHPKRAMIREFNFSKIICKSSSVITDIYLNKNTIERILKKIQVNDYNKLLVSAETITRKHNGTIYPEYIKYLSDQFNITPEKALHIGDNKQADGEMAKRHGLRSYVFQKAMDNYRQSKIAKTMEASIKNSGISSSILNGLFANKYHAGHWFKTNKTSLFKGEDYNYGYMAIGPLVAGFTQWLHRRVQKLGIEQIFFLSRDGWILKQAYEKMYGSLENQPKINYLYSSRRAAMVASIRTKEDIYEVASQNFNARSISDFIESRFGVNPNKIKFETFTKYGFNKESIVSPYFDHGNLCRFLDEISPLILENSRLERESYQDYLDEVGFTSAAKKENIAVVDIGYSGSMQYYLKKINQLDKLHGFYFLTHHHSRDHFTNEHFEGYLQDLDDHKISYRHALNDHVFIFEAALSSPEGSLMKFEGKGNMRRAVFIEAEEEVVRRLALSNAHSGVTDFINDISSRLGSYFSDFEISPILSSRIILNFADHPNPIDAKLFVDHGVENIFGGGSVCLISPVHKHYLNNNGSIKDEIKDQLIKASKWKKGAEAFYTSFGSNNFDENNILTIDIKSKSNLKTFPAKIVKTKIGRKRAKLKNDPYLFFKDAKNPVFRNLKFIFIRNTLMGEMSKRILNSIIR